MDALAALSPFLAAALSSFLTWRVTLRKQASVDSSHVLKESAALRDFVKSLFDAEREMHLAERKALNEEIDRLKSRLGELESAKDKDLRDLREMAERERNNILEIANLKIRINELEHKIENLETQNAALRANAQPA